MTGERDPSFALDQVGDKTFGISLATDGSALYLGAGGSDYVARYGLDGLQHWKRDTSGSSQSVEIHDGELLVGGHFREVADAVGDNCGFFKASKPGRSIRTMSASPRQAPQVTRSVVTSRAGA